MQRRPSIGAKRDRHGERQSHHPVPAGPMLLGGTRRWQLEPDASVAAKPEVYPYEHKMEASRHATYRPGVNMSRCYVGRSVRGPPGSYNRGGSLPFRLEPRGGTG